MSRPVPRLAVALISLAMPACWPYLPGPYVEAADGPGVVDPDPDPDPDPDTEPEPERVDAVVLSGTVNRVQPLGDYWSDDTPTAEVILGWQASPDPDLDPWHTITATGRGCQLEPSLSRWLGTLDRELPAPDLVVRGGRGEGSIPWDADAGLWYTSSFDADQIRPGGRLSLLRTEVDGAALAAPDLALLPPGIDFRGPELDGAQPSIVRPDALSWSWTSRVDAVDRVVLDIAIGDGSYEVLERVRCVAPVSDGRIRVPEGMWQQLDDAVMAYVRLSTASESQVELDEVGREAAVVGLSTELGAVMFE